MPNTLFMNREKELQAELHARRFTLYVGIGGILMFFAAMTSAYLVRRSAGNWLEFGLPTIFYVSTVILLLSSITMHWSLNAYRKGNEGMYQLMLAVTFLSGLTFIVLQYMGWMELNSLGVFLQTNPSSSFLFVITGIHAAHILGGLAAIAVAVIRSQKLEFKITPRRKNALLMTTIYWHFVDVLWIYLLIFFITQ